jgi:hypothetical protein
VPADKEEWLNTTCLNALRSLVDLVEVRVDTCAIALTVCVIAQAFSPRVDFLLRDLLRLLSGFVLQVCDGVRVCDVTRVYVCECDVFQCD